MQKKQQQTNSRLYQMSLRGFFPKKTFNQDPKANHVPIETVYDTVRMVDIRDVVVMHDKMTLVGRGSIFG